MIFFSVKVIVCDGCFVLFLCNFCDEWELLGGWFEVGELFEDVVICEV